MLELPSQTVFHAIENAIKTYRRFAQQRIASEISGLTVDHALILIYIDEHPEMNQNELAELLFKDNASLTRMIKAMVREGFIQRAINPDDLRRYKLLLTDKGKSVVGTLPGIIGENRATALQGISLQELNNLKTTLNKIIINCKNEEK